MSTSEQTNSLPPLAKERVLSLDVLRGFDLLFLLCLGPLFTSVANGPLSEFFKGSPFWQKVLNQFHHVPWEGFVAWDLIMPLFLFMVGAALPFSLSKYTGNQGRPTAQLYLRIFRRVLLLWILGMVAQGNLLSLKLQGLNFYSNTLQAIAAGYLIACIFYLTMRTPMQIVFTFLLLATYWALMTYVKVDGYGGGSFQPESNLAEWVDRTVLGRWRAGVVFKAGGIWEFSSTSHYTWILSSLTFGVTTMLGVFSGEIIRRQFAPKIKVENADESTEKATAPLSKGKVFSALLVLGIFLTLVGYGWSKIPEGSFGYCPLIKTIWTPSMTLFAGGLSFLLLAIFYGIIDLAGFHWGTTFFIVIGMNAITAYMLPRFINLRSVAEMFLYGTKQYLETWYGPMIVLVGFLLLWYILWVMFRCKKFLRV